MSTHDQLEQLSAYLDGELSADERRGIDSHLPTCAECRGVLEALRATVADLRALEEPEPSPQDSWAIRSALARARAGGRSARVAVAAGSVAAALIAFAAVSLSNRGPTAEFDAPGRTGPSLDLALVSVSAADYDEDSARDLLGTSGAQTKTLGAPAATGGGYEFADQYRAAPKAAPLAIPSPSATPASAYAARIRDCERQILSGSPESARATAYIVASYRGTPAFFLRYEVPASGPERVELWVVRRADCETLYFAQRKI